MSKGYPKYSKTAQQGDAGVDLVARTVTDDFHWLFKRNHQEHDFGIDGQIEIIADDGSVTGQILAVQIKHGPSYLKQKNRWGYIYHGENKHFNYLSNYPTPVLIIIGDPLEKKAYWEVFRPEQIEGTPNGWTLTIPFSNLLSGSKAALKELVRDSVDSLGALQDYWAANQLLIKSGVVFYVIDQRDVLTKNTSRVRQFFDRLQATKKLALGCQGKVYLAFHGYDEDARELWEIPEVRLFVCDLANQLPELFFFLMTGIDSHPLKIFAACTCDGKRISEPISQKITIEYDAKKLSQFMEYQFKGLNSLTEWIGLSAEENMKIGLAAIDALGMDTKEIRAKHGQSE